MSEDAVGPGQLWESLKPLDGHREKSLLYVLVNREDGHRGLMFCYCMSGLGAGHAALWTISTAWYRRVA